MTKFFNDLPVYGSMIKASVQSRMEYRGSFIMYILTIMGFYTAQVSVIAVMLNQFKEINGWKTGEVAFLYGLLVFANGIISTLFNGFLEFSDFVRLGTFDRILLRPLSPLFSILCMRFEPGGLANLILGVAALVVASSWTAIHWSFVHVLFLVAVLLGGSLILGAIRIIIAASAFYTVSNEGAQHLFVFSSREFLLYPIDIYNKPVKFALTFLFPLAFINFYPAHFFLSKETDSLFHPVFVFLTLPVGIFVTAVAIWFWRKAIRHYGSTGS